MNLSTSLEAEYAFAGKTLGDVRRGSRMISMLCTLVRNPGGEVSKVFRDAAQQQAAYDFLEHKTVKAAAVQKVASVATARRCRGEKRVFGILDGSSVTVTDKARNKGLGSIGPRRAGARGLKMINVLAIDEAGQSVGVLAQEIWARPRKRPKKGYRPLRKRESYRWHRALDTATATLAEHAPGTVFHALIDREGDASELMWHLHELGCEFTVRANGTRVAKVEEAFVPLMPQLKRQKVVARMTIEVPRKGDRPKRMATLDIRAIRLDVRLCDRHTKTERVVPLTAVWAHEQHPPRGVEPLNWLLYTTDRVKGAKAAVAVVVRYARRWRIEEFHKALKSAGGCIEDTQLRSASAIIKWVTLCSIVATRAQRLRDLAKTTPDAPASVELSAEEIEALVLLKSQEKRRTETVSAEGLTIRQAVRWIGDLGGFAATGVSTKMPGPKVIARGLVRVLEAVTVIRALRAVEKKR